MKTMIKSDICNVTKKVSSGLIHADNWA